MKIVIPTDFSDNAHGAVLYGLHLAHKFDSVVTILHIYDVPDIHGGGLQHTMEEYINLMQDEGKRNLEEYMLKLSKVIVENGYNNISLESKLVGGSVAKRLSALVRSENMDLVVMGTQGRTASEAFFLGNVTSETLESVEVPVLTVPPQMREKGDLGDVVFATDYSDIAYKCMRWLSEFTSLGKLSVSTLHIGFHNEAKESRWKETFSDVIQKHQVIEEKDFITGLKLYAEDHKTDMIAMTITKKNFLYKLFNKPRVEKASYQKKIPVLGIPQEFLEKLEK